VDEESAHWAIRTNEGEAFAKDLAGLAEAAWPEFAKYHDAEAKLPGKDKLTLYAFRDYEDYRRYCVETKSEDYLGAAGFAKSDSTIAVGWNKTSNRQQFLQTMVHEAAHLYYSRCAPRRSRVVVRRSHGDLLRGVRVGRQSLEVRRGQRGPPALRPQRDEGRNAHPPRRPPRRRGDQAHQH